MSYYKEPLRTDRRLDHSARGDSQNEFGIMKHLEKIEDSVHYWPKLIYEVEEISAPLFFSRRP
jgi:hypothetical protein